MTQINVHKNMPGQFSWSMHVDEDGKRFASSDSCHHDQCRTRKLNGSSAQEGERTDNDVIGNYLRRTNVETNVETNRTPISRPDQYLGSMQVDEDGSYIWESKTAP